MVMGGMFAGHDECPGQVIVKNGKKYKYSWGTCTKTASLWHTPYIRKMDRLKHIVKKVLGEAKDDKPFTEEGVEVMVPYKGSVNDMIEELAGGVYRSMWYQGARSIDELRKKARVQLVSSTNPLEVVPRIALK